MDFQISNIEIDGKDFRKIVLVDESVGITKINEIKSAIISELDTGNKFIAIDLSQVNTINSSGLGILINCLKLIKETGGELKLLSPGDKLDHIFKITKLDTVFDISS